MNIIPFQSPDFTIRAVDIDGEPWFVGKDVAEALGYTNPSKAMGDHCKGVAKRYPLQTKGGTQEMRLINEPDLFRLVVNSQLPAADKFERWVFEDVLPAIRKTGSYQTPALPPAKQAKEALQLAAAAFRTARTFGFDQNMATLSANQFVRKMTGLNLLEGFGQTHLVAEQQTLYHTPTEIGQQIDVATNFESLEKAA